MNELVLMFGIHSDSTLIELIPLFGILTGIIIPIAIFLWLYHDAKNKRATILEISKHLDDNSKLDQFLTKGRNNQSIIEEVELSQFLLV